MMARNQLEAQLEAIRNTKTILTKQYNEKMEILNKEEKTILEQLKGRYL